MFRPPVIPSRIALVVALVLSSVRLDAALTLDVSRDYRPVYSLVVSNEPIAKVAVEVTRRTGWKISITERATQRITMRALSTDPAELIRFLAAAGRRRLDVRGNSARLSYRHEPEVWLDVKEADARVVLESVRQQCGVANLMIDPGVQGSGTFLFKGVPCGIAWRKVLQTLGLASMSESDALMAVGTDR